MSVIPSLYLHIPFCARRCPYCDFAVSVNRRDAFRVAYVAALESELDAVLKEKPRFQTIYCGGGTPTELSPAVLNKILARVESGAEIESNAERTLEANPEHLSPANLAELRAGGWNRLSLGVQSLDDAVLARLGRFHTSEDAEKAANLAREAGWNAVSLDLIFGAPLQSLDSWRATLEHAAKFDIQHISCYSLTIERGTAFGLEVEKGRLRAPDDDEQADFLDAAREILGINGFERYEVSNWAKAGFESRHNQNYWRGGDYFGVGCGAHSHFGGHRWWNERDAKLYARNIQEHGNARAGEEFLDDAARATEFLALGLRARDGFELEQVRALLDEKARRAFDAALANLSANGLIEVESGRVWAPEIRWVLADAIALRLMPD